MTRMLGFLGVLALSACAPLFQRGPRPDPNVESQYHRAIALLGPGSPTQALDSAVVFLDGYLAHTGYVERRPEAQILKRLASDAIQLSKVAAALQREQADTAGSRPRTEDASAARPDSDSLKEIQRLKDALATANAELERIKKRLATQKP